MRSALRTGHRRCLRPGAARRSARPYRPSSGRRRPALHARRRGPRSIMTICSHSSCTRSSWWLDNSTVRPCRTRSVRVCDRSDGDRVQPRKRFIQDDDLRIVDQRGRQLQLRHAEHLGLHAHSLPSGDTKPGTRHASDKETGKPTRCAATYIQRRQWRISSLENRPRQNLSRTMPRPILLGQSIDN